MNSLLAAPPKAGLRTYAPSKQDRAYVGAGLAFLNLTAPFWSSIVYSSMTVAYSTDIPIAATDAHFIYVNPRGMRELGWTFENVAFVLAHEALHFIFGDLHMAVWWRQQQSVIGPDGTALPYDPRLMNAAMDYRINAALVDGKVGTMPKQGLLDRNLSAKGMESCVEIYARLFEQAADSRLPEGFDIHLEPSQQEAEEDKAGGKLKRAQAIATARLAAETAGLGSVPAAVAALIGELLEPRVRWQDHLKACMQRASGVPGNDWAKLNKRMISRPDPWGRIAFARRTEFGCGTVVVGYDTSGSCANQHTQARFFSEMAAIVADLNPAELIVVWCDAQVQRVDMLEDPTDLDDLRTDINAKGGAPGGGGTDLRKIFDHIRDEAIEPDMLIVLTDMYTPFPTEPEYPTIWCSITKGKPAPFGDLVECGDMQ